MWLEAGVVPALGLSLPFCTMSTGGLRGPHPKSLLGVGCWASTEPPEGRLGRKRRRKARRRHRGPQVWSGPPRPGPEKEEGRLGMGRLGSLEFPPLDTQWGPGNRLTFIQAELVTRPGPSTLDHETSGQLSTGWDHMSPGAPMAPALTHLLSKGPRAGGGVQGLPSVAGPPAAVSKDPRSWWHLGPSSASDHSPALSTPLPVGVGVGSSQWPEGGSLRPQGSCWTFLALTGLRAGWGSSGLVVIRARDLLPTVRICLSPQLAGTGGPSRRRRG